MSRQKSMTHKWHVMDLFSGAGGMSLGFKLQGDFQTSIAFDNWLPAVDTISYNNPEIEVITTDLSDVLDETHEAGIALRSRMSDFLGKIDVVLGGPPCQGMSLAGKRLANDKRNQLFLSFVEVVRIVRPRVFVMENVVGLLTAEGGRIKEAILNSFREIGYSLLGGNEPTTLYAEWYGVPQHRRRVFFVGIAPECDPESFAKFWPPLAEFRTYEFGSNGFGSSQADLFTDLRTPITVQEAISDLPAIKSGEGADVVHYPKLGLRPLTPYQQEMRNWSNCPYSIDKPVIYNHEAPNHTRKLIEMIAKARPGESVDPKYADSRKWNGDAPSFTIKALGAGGGSTNRRAFHYDPDTPRGSTVRENARIQSFPDWYRFLGPKTHQMSQVGNAVPPLMAKAIAEIISRGLSYGD